MIVFGAMFLNIYMGYRTRKNKATAKVAKQPVAANDDQEPLIKVATSSKEWIECLLCATAASKISTHKINTRTRLIDDF